MSATAKTQPGAIVTGSRVESLVQQLAEIRAQLVEERQLLLARVVIIDEALGQQSVQPQAVKSAAKARTQGIGDAIVAYIQSRPWVTIREVQVGFPEAKPSSVEATVRNLSAAGKLIKDQGNPRKFAIPGAPEQKANGLNSGAGARVVGGT